MEELKLNPESAKNRLELSENEFELFEEIRNEANTEIRAELRGGKIREIETSRTTTNIPRNKEIDSQIEKSEMYGRIITQYEKGKKRSVQIVKRKRFDK